jgi:hypothetical protein
VFAWIASWTAQEWAAAGAWAQAIVTITAVFVALHQVKDIRSQNRRWRTLKICNRYHLEPHLVEIAARLRAVVDAVEKGDKDALPVRA